MKKVVFLLAALLIALTALTPALAESPAADIRVASLKGPTTMGLVKLMKDAEAGASQNAYAFTLAATADEVVPLVAKGEIDIAMVPA
ncbi:MAG: ABC transporter substrate-binding protein, partial [Clostridiales bacterium]|nr:ABC transporter substrate-binding protein [Clostridiales bacterium]